VLGLAFGQGNFALNLPVFPMQIERHQGVAFLLGFDDQAADVVFF
jgi:hypothetical protein